VHGTCADRGSNARSRDDEELAVEGVGPGTVLDGRYTLGSREAQRAGTERWTASERDLGRSVAILVLPVGDPRAAAVLDAARVAAGLDIPGLVRILDIGHNDRVAWVVEEPLEDARSVVDLVRSGGLPGDEVRRIVGEAASALDAAAARGVHHLRLVPEEVLRTADGEVKVRGIATEAALAGADESAADAARTDAVALVALTYAALTGLWPLAEGETSLGPAPRLIQGVAAPSEIAAGVPRDLDGLARLTLNDDGGPHSPGDYARQIAPWSSRPIQGRSTLPAMPVAEPEPTPESAAQVSESASESAPTEAVEAPRSLTPAALHPTDGEQTEETPAAGLPAVGAATAGALAAGASAAATAGADAASATAAGTASAASAAPAPSTAATAPIPVTPASSPTEPIATTGPAAAPRRVLVEHDPIERLVPEEPLTKDESKVALGLVAAFVVLSLVVGLWGVSRIGENSTFDFSIGSRPKVTASAQPSGSAAPAEGPKPLAILSADGFDPLGDNKENGKDAPKVFDGDPATAWTSEGYKTPALGGIKSGVGVIIDLGPNTAPKQVNLVLGAPASVEVHFAGDRSLDGALKVGEQADANGAVSFEVAPEAAGKQYLIVWFTGLSQVDGSYRAVLAEVGVLG
jgi:hypothetical protein